MKTRIQFKCKPTFKTDDVFENHLEVLTDLGTNQCIRCNYEVTA